MGPKKHKPNGSGFATPFRPGNILRLRVENFTTYTYGEFTLLPTLNMIIGPNGTGKSTFVAAVCLGLGGKVEFIRRKTLELMVKSGTSEAMVEVTLKNHGTEPDLVIERRILRQNRSKWKVNGEECDGRRVQQIVASFNIQLDNLCHFLPQERVAEFASLSPEKLLFETERTIGDNSLLEKHQLLIELDLLWVELTGSIEKLEETISSLRTDVAKFEAEAERYKDYEDKAVLIDHHKKLLPYAKLQDVKERMKHLKKVRDDAKQLLHEFAHKTAPLVELKTSAEKELSQHQSTASELEESLRKRNEHNSALLTKSSEIARSIQTLKTDIDSLQTRTQKQKQELNDTMAEKAELERKLAATESVDEGELQQLAEQRQLKHEEKLRHDEDLDTCRYEGNMVKREFEQLEMRFSEEKRKLDNNDRLEIFGTKGTRYRAELMENAYRAHVLLRKERKAHQLRYYESPVVSCHVTHPRYAKYFEKVVDNNSLFALFFESEDQYHQVSGLLPREVNVPMRVIPKEALPPQPMPVLKLKQYGFDGYLSDFISGPEPVVRALCQRAMLHCIPVALKPINPDIVKKLLKPSGSDRVLFMRFIVENSLFMVSRSKYGSRQIFYRTEHIGVAQVMGAEGLTDDIKREIQTRLATLKLKMEALVAKKEELERKRRQQLDILAETEQQLQELDTKVRSQRKKEEAKLKLEENLKFIVQRITDLEHSTSQDYTEKIQETEAELLQAYIDHAESYAEVAECNEQLVSDTIELKKTELLVQQSENKILAHEQLLQELELLKTELQQSYADAKAKYDEYKKGDAAKEIREQRLTDEEREIIRGLAENYLANSQLSEHFIATKIEQLEDELSLLSNVDRGSIELLKIKKTDLDLAERQLPELLRKKESLHDRMQKIAIPWEEELSSLVELMLQAFQKNFITVASDGQVRLVKLERYKLWKLEILVKFRENSELKVLDHQLQSGGERAVSTIFFIMSLQGLLNASIRIVDEINQGMDPKNEKMAHKYLVHTACQKGASQYFLVTPKLLTGLYYHPDMAIHCIFTGPHLEASQGRLLDFRA